VKYFDQVTRIQYFHWTDILDRSASFNHVNPARFVL
jgi:hypothetical protein